MSPVSVVTGAGLADSLGLGVFLDLDFFDGLNFILSKEFGLFWISIQFVRIDFPTKRHSALNSEISLFVY